MRTTTLLILTLSFVGCGGGSGGNGIGPTSEDITRIECGLNANNQNSCQQVTVPRVNLHGIWSGTLFVQGGGSVDLTGLAFDNHLYFSSSDFNFKGTFGTNETGDLEGSGTRHLITGGLDGTFTIEGVGTEQSTIFVDYTHSSGEVGNINLVFDSIYSNGSDLPDLEGSYSASLPTGYFANINVAGAGAIDGSDSNGCEISGEFSIIDSDVNAYNVNLVTSSCAQAVTRHGFAYYNDVTHILNIALPYTNGMLFFILNPT